MLRHLLLCTPFYLRGLSFLTATFKRWCSPFVQAKNAKNTPSGRIAELILSVFGGWRSAGVQRWVLRLPPSVPPILAPACFAVSPMTVKFGGCSPNLM